MFEALFKLDYYKAFALGQVLCCLEKYGRMYSQRPLSVLFVSSISCEILPMRTKLRKIGDSAKILNFAV